jgi:ectoine hydroxylase-related dioxygenase (phytanoyl-CoA dioxygenase family)
MEPGASDSYAVLHKAGVLLQPKVIPEAIIQEWAKTAEECYQRIQTIEQQGGLEAVQKSLSPGQKYVSTASSFTLEAAFPEESGRRILKQIADSPVRNCIEEVLGGQAVCDLDQAWVRRQYAPSRYPARHSPHAWHQDGALGYDFLGAMTTGHDAKALLPMITCWIPLTPCGVDAPGLEFIAERTEALLPVTSLQDAYLRSQYPAEAFWRPVMQAGDSLLFRSGVLHRTFVTSEMIRNRTSIELRFVLRDQIPGRLAQDRFVALGELSEC